MMKKISSGFLALVFLLQAFLPSLAYANQAIPSDTKIISEDFKGSDNTVTIGKLKGVGFSKDNPTASISIEEVKEKNRKNTDALDGLEISDENIPQAMMSSNSPYIQGQQPADPDKPKYWANVKGELTTAGIDGGTFDWNKVLGQGAKVKLLFTQTNGNVMTGVRFYLEVDKDGTYTWSNSDGNPTYLPLYDVDGNPYTYNVQIERNFSENVQLIIQEINGTPKVSWRPEGDKQVATISFLDIKIQQLASTKFVSEWHTSVAEAERPQIEGYFEADTDVDNDFNFPKIDTIRTILRSSFVENFVEDEDNGPWSFLPDELETTPKTVEVKTDTQGLIFEENDGVKTVKSGDHKFKYDFTYDVIDGGKLTMTEIIPVTFDANGGKFASITDPNAEQKIVKEVEYDGTLTDKAEEPTKDRETFKGWSDSPTGTTPVSDDFFKNIKDAKTLYAIWDKNDIVVEQLEVKESFKDGDAWVNDFIPALETLKGQVKIKDASGTPQALADDDTFEILDDDGTAITGDDLKNYLYEKLQEKDNPKDEPTRVETVKAKVTVNGTSKTVDIPIKVFKNIYEAKTLSKKPHYVPADYVKVTLDPTTKAKEPQKTYYYVNPKAKVVIPGEDPVGTGDNQFAKWLIKGTETEYKLVDKPRHQFEAETTIEAQYVSDVIPQTGNQKPDTVPANFVEVKFVPTEKATDTAEKIYWVNPEKEVTIPVKDPVGKQYYTFNEWKIGDVTSGETYTVGTAKKFGTATTITATYDEAKNIISYDPSVPDPMVRPEGYVRVTFAAEPGLKLTDQKAYYVKKNAKITLKAIKNDTTNYGYPGVTANTGYKFKEWDKADTFEIEEADIVVTAKATKLGNVIPEKDKNGNDNEKPEGYKEVNFVIKTEDKDKGSITGVNKFYVNPTEYVTINPPTTEAKTGYKFGAWDQDAKIPTVYDKDTTITGFFNELDDVIPNKNPDGTKNKKPDNYATVTFVLEKFNGNEVGRFNGEDITVYYVNPEKEVYLRTPTPIADTGYKFNFWTPQVVKKKYTEDTTINGYFKKLDDIIPGDKDTPKGYVRVEFFKGLNGELKGNTLYYVNPYAGKTIGDVTHPDVIPNVGYEHKGWSVEDTIEINNPHKEFRVTAEYKDGPEIVPKTKDDDSEKPKGYITVTFEKGEHGKLEGTTVYYVNPNKAVALDDKAPKVTPNTGYDFAGWDTQIEKKIQYSNGDVITALYNEKGDVIPQEKTDGSDKPAGYLTVTFDKGDHGELSGKTVYYVKPNKEVTVPAPTVKPETGWKQKDGNEAWDKALTQKFTDKNTTITAQYDSIDNIVPGDKPKPDGYVTITFKAVNGSLSGTTTYYVNPNKEVDLKDQANGLSKKADVGYTADGGTWDKLKGKFTEGEKITFTFVALPDVIEDKPGTTKPEGYVTVKFIAGTNGSLEGGDKTYYVNPNAKVKIGGTDIPVPATTPKTDYEFKEWIDAVDKTNPIIDNQTHVAQFVYNPATVTLTYEAPDAISGEVPDAQTVKKGDKVILADANTLKKDNATFRGWMIDGKEYAAGASVTLNDNTTATAVWTTNSHTVEFDTDGGGYIPSQKVVHGNKIKPVDPPTKPGSTFTGWTLNEKPFDPTTGKITGDTILVANYVPNVVEQEQGKDKPKVPDNFVQVTVDPTDKATDPTTQVFWVKPNETVQIPAKHPTGKQVGDTTYVFDSWNPSLIGKFSGPTTIEAQYKKQTPLTPIFDPRITTGVVATDLNKQPPLDAYKDQIKSETNKEFDLVEIVEQPKVDESGFTSAKIKIRFTENGMTQVVDVLVYVKPDPVIIEKPVPGDCNNSCDQPNQPNQPNIGMDALNTTDHYQYLIGYPDGNFAPNRGMTRAEVATMFTRLLKERPVKGQRYYTGFSDIQDGDWYANTVGYAVQVGIVSGYPDGSFKPNKPITRAEFASIASRFDALAQGNNIAFNDLAPSHWGYNAIRSAATKGWISGYPDNTFRPEKAISRAEVTSITNRMLNRYADLYWIDAHRGEVIRFGDVKRGDWYFEPIMEATMGHDFIRDRDGKTEHWSGLNGKSFI